MLVMNVIAEILKKEGVSNLFCFPTTPIIEAAARDCFVAALLAMKTLSLRAKRRNLVERRRLTPETVRAGPRRQGGAGSGLNCGLPAGNEKAASYPAVP